MTPFVIWLNKNELDELLSTIIKSDVDFNAKQELFDKDEFVNYAEHLFKQNNRLIQLFRKIEPLNEIQKNKVHVKGIKQKCEQHKNNLNNLKSHCSIYSKPNSHHLSNSDHDFSCKDCVAVKLGLVTI